jgi:imidazole glycerol phosphate synthase glutamine amidotransferase subunit
VKTIGVVDYGVGNHASVGQALRGLGYRVRLTAEAAQLDATDLLVLPGVGAFPPAMHALHQRGLVVYLRTQAEAGRPLLGICLGMQLLATGSHEHGYTPGLDLIPGEVHQMEGARWHIGWNEVECVGDDPLLRTSHRRHFYFNHSCVYNGPPQYRIGVARHPAPIAAAIRRANIVGVQFHPEKSQEAGQALLRNVIEGLAHA